MQKRRTGYNFAVGIDDETIGAFDSKDDANECLDFVAHKIMVALGIKKETNCYIEKSDGLYYVEKYEVENPENALCGMAFIETLPLNKLEIPTPFVRIKKH